MEANKCPKCGKYILGEYCYKCKINIRDYISNNEALPDFIRDIFEKNNE